MKNKEVIIRFRVTISEAEKLDSMAEEAGMPDRSKYLRHLLQKEHTGNAVTVYNLAPIEKGFANINRLGSNLNQIAYAVNLRILNQAAQEYAPITIDERKHLSSALSALESEVEALKKQIITLCKERHNGKV